MILHFIGSIDAQPISWPSLQKSIDEISSLQAPVFRDLIFLYLNLARKDLFSQFFSFSGFLVRKFLKHALVADNTERIVVRGYAMLLAADDFRSHVSHCSCCAGNRDVRDVLADAEITQPQIVPVIKHQVGRLYVFVDDAFLMDHFECHDDAGHEKFWLRRPTCLLFTEFSFLFQVPLEVTARHVVEHHVHVFAILKRKSEIHQEPCYLGLLIRETPHNLGFFLQMLDRVLVEDNDFSDDLDSEDGLGILVLGFEHLGVASLSDLI